MTAPRKIHDPAESSALFVVTGQVHEALLRRAASIADALDSELEIFCPIVVPPAPHTGVPGDAPSWKDDLSLAREDGRRKAGRVQSIMNLISIESHIETGVCRSMTEAIINASDRLRPDLVLLPSPDEHALVNKPFHAQYEDLQPAIDAPVWILEQAEPSGSNVCALVFLDSVRGKNAADAERVVANAGRIAKRFGSDVHLIACVGQPAALTVAKEALAPSSLSIAQRREDRLVRRLYELADNYAIPSPHVQMLHGEPSENLAELIDPLEIGVLVTSARPRRWLGGLVKRHRTADLFDLECDLMILGETDATYA